MLAFVLFAIVVGILVLPLGLWLLDLSSGGSSLGLGPWDRVFAAEWLGLFALADVLLLVSVVLPLTPAAALLVTATAVALAARTNQVQRSLQELVSSIRPLAVGTTFVAAGAVGLYVSRLPGAYDTGLYHYQFVRWLAEHGAVDGLGLLHFRFGFVSSWFALSAPVDSALPTRAAPFAAGFILLLSVGHGVVLLARSLGGRARVRDLMLLGGLAGAAVAAEVVGDFAGSMSPDLVLFYLPMIIVWLALVDERDHGRVGPAVVLSALAVTVKLAAVPLLVVVALWRVARSRSRTGIVAAIMVWSLIAAVPVVLVSIVHTRCLWFPVAVSCFSGRSGVGAQVAASVAEEVTTWARWRSASPESFEAFAWVSGWLERRRFHGLLDVASVTATLALVPLVARKAIRDVGLVVLVATTGLLFTYWTAPDMRFQVPYLVLPISAVIAVCLHSATRFRLSSRLSTFGALTGLGVVCVVMATRAVTMYPSPSPSAADELSLSSRLILPPSANVELAQRRPESWQHDIQAFALVSHELGSWTVLTPEGDDDRCWASPLPCTPYPDARVRPRGDNLGEGFYHLDTRARDEPELSRSRGAPPRSSRGPRLVRNL